MPVFARIKKWYAKYERPLSSVSLVGGFVFDALTLTRVDRFWENFWVVAHLLIVAVCIVLVNREEEGKMDSADPDKLHFWFINILQFFFGGLLSTFLVFYFRSGTLAASWPFLLILAAAFVANESLKKHYARLDFQLSLFFLCVFSFAIFLVPVLLHAIGPWVFLLSGAASVVLFWLFFRVLRYFSGERFSRKQKTTLFLSIAGIFAAVNIFYFLNLLPPIPLSLTDGGIYHSLVRNPGGGYAIETEPAGPFAFLGWEPTVHIITGDPLYAYSAIFSPPDFSMNIIHEWQWQNPATGQWTTMSRVTLAVVGGRDGGYNTYSIENNLMAGAWRVRVLTQGGQVVGSLEFKVILVSTEPSLTSAIKM